MAAGPERAARMTSGVSCRPDCATVTRRKALMNSGLEREPT